MLADGAWKRMNMSNYITCDDYDGKNAPKRIGLNMKNYFTKVTLRINFLFIQSINNKITYIRIVQNPRHMGQ